MSGARRIQVRAVGRFGEDTGYRPPPRSKPEPAVATWRTGRLERALCTKGGSSRFRFRKTSTSSLWHRVNRIARVGTPFGETVWQQATAKRLGLESTLRPPGRPKRLRPDR
jgi:hypothetical protein